MSIPSPRSTSVLIALSLLAALGLARVEGNKIAVDSPWRSEMLEATQRMRQATEWVRQTRLNKGWRPSVDSDTRSAALIGSKQSPITSLPGNLDSKLASTSPHFGAVVVDLLKQAKVQSGDLVAVALSGSYPALNLATFAALETLGVEALVLSSVASSSWGANDPTLTWLDIERGLTEAGLFEIRSLAASPGAGEDRGKGLDPQGLQLIREAAKRNVLPLLEAPDLTHSVEDRLTLYDQARGQRPLAAYINVGGGVASLGRLKSGASWPVGLSQVPMDSSLFKIPGVAHRFAHQGVPILHLTDAPSLAERYGLSHSIAPGSLGLYSQMQYDRRLAGTLFSALILIVGLLTWADRRRHGLARNASDNTHKASTSPLADTLAPTTKPALAKVQVLLLIGLASFSTLPLPCQADHLKIHDLHPLTLDLLGAERTYFLLPPGKRREMIISGPADVEILTRALLEENTSFVEYHLTYRLDREERQDRTLRTERLQNATTLLDGKVFGVGSLRKQRLYVEPGEHRLSLRYRKASRHQQPIAIRLRVSSPLEKSLEGSDPNSWSLSARLETAYDSNILRYSEKFIERFDAGLEPGRFRVDSLDDVVTEVRLRLTRHFLGFQGRKAQLHLRLDHHAFGRNNIKDWSRWQLGWRQELPRDWKLSLVAIGMPEFYIRHQRDADLSSKANNFEDFYPFEFSRYIVNSTLEKRWSFRWRSAFEIRAGETDYNESFQEFDADDLRFGFRIDHRFSTDWRLRARYRFTDSRARGFDQPGETRTDSDDNDPSFEEQAFLLSARWRRQGSPRARTLLFEAEHFIRRYTTNRPPAESPIYAGREDNRWRLSASFAWTLHESVRAAAFLDAWQRSSDSSLSPVDLGREKNYKQFLAGIRLTWLR